MSEPTPTTPKPETETPQALDPALQERVEAFTSDCLNNHSPIACHQLAEFSSVVQSDFAQSFKLYHNSCYNEKSPHVKKGDQQGIVTGPSGSRFYPPSCFNLARQHLSGRGTVKSDLSAYKALVRSCDEAGHVGACHHLGVMLLSGSETVGKDEARGLKCLERSCEMGDVSSCHAVASVVLAGSETYPEVARLYADEEKRRSRVITALDGGCKGGYAPSCFNLAAFYKSIGDKANFGVYKGITEGLVRSGNGSGVGQKGGGMRVG